MYRINKTSFGYHVVIEGSLSDAETGQLKLEVAGRLSDQVDNFSVIVDLRKLIPPHSGSLEVLRDCVEFALQAGMKRIAIIYTSPVVRDQIKQTAFMSGRNPVGRYIDALKTDDPERAAREYVEDGIEPPSSLQETQISRAR